MMKMTVRRRRTIVARTAIDWLVSTHCRPTTQLEHERPNVRRVAAYAQCLSRTLTVQRNGESGGSRIRRFNIAAWLRWLLSKTDASLFESKLKLVGQTDANFAFPLRQGTPRSCAVNLITIARSPARSCGRDIGRQREFSNCPLTVRPLFIW